MSDGILRALVTGEQHDLLRMNQRTAYYANWIESELRDGRETYLVTVFNTERAQFIDTALQSGVTVEEIVWVDQGAFDGQAETYELLVGAPGTGWKEPE